jgi:Polysaccharide deacetylase
LKSIGSVELIIAGRYIRDPITCAKPILDKYGFKASFFVVCNYAGRGDRMSWQEIKTLHNEGYDVESHNMNHNHMNQMTPDVLTYEIGQSKQCLADHGINATIFAYPFDIGWNDPTIVNIVSKYYDLLSKTPRINQFTNKPEYFHSYCLKFIIAERIPKEWKTDGILHRMLSWVSQPGISEFDIKEVLNEEAIYQEQQELFDRFVAFRKKIMIYRLVHFNDPVANIDVGVVTEPSVVINQNMNAIMYVYAPNGRLIKISSFPKGFVIKSTTGQTQLATTITNSTIKKVKADAVFTDAAKSANFSNPLNIDLNLGQKIPPP